MITFNGASGWRLAWTRQVLGRSRNIVDASVTIIITGITVFRPDHAVTKIAGGVTGLSAILITIGTRDISSAARAGPPSAGRAALSSTDRALSSGPVATPCQRSSALSRLVINQPIGVVITVVADFRVGRLARNDIATTTTDNLACCTAASDTGASPNP
ncbi:MAG: hypothetical protein EOP84_02145 [Verrucomicrobiaceae bacterium]|nr:MAG: hypothetical protein EOP84_02145 [Verrucomicrobiaceae bacterium]